MLDLARFAGTGPKVADLDAHRKLVCELLQGQTPQPHPIPVVTSAVGGDQQSAGHWMAQLTHLVPPATDAHTQPLILANIVDPAKWDFAQDRINKIIDSGRFGNLFVWLFKYMKFICAPVILF